MCMHLDRTHTSCWSSIPGCHFFSLKVALPKTVKCMRPQSTQLGRGAVGAHTARGARSAHSTLITHTAHLQPSHRPVSFTRDDILQNMLDRRITCQPTFGRTRSKLPLRASIYTHHLYDCWRWVWPKTTAVVAVVQKERSYA